MKIRNISSGSLLLKTLNYGTFNFKIGQERDDIPDDAKIITPTVFWTKIVDTPVGINVTTEPIKEEVVEKVEEEVSNEEKLEEVTTNETSETAEEVPAENTAAETEELIETEAVHEAEMAEIPVEDDAVLEFEEEKPEYTAVGPQESPEVFENTVEENETTEEEKAEEDNVLQKEINSITLNTDNSNVEETTEEEQSQIEELQVSEDQTSGMQALVLPASIIELAKSRYGFEKKVQLMKEEAANSGINLEEFKGILIADYGVDIDATFRE